MKPEKARTILQSLVLLRRANKITTEDLVNMASSVNIEFRYYEDHDDYLIVEYSSVVPNLRGGTNRYVNNFEIPLN